MPRTRPDPPNLLLLRPRRLLEYETGEDGLVTLAVPRFRHPLAISWIVPFLQKPTFSMRLDAPGSFIWQHCDGRTTVEEMAGALRERFGEEMEPLYDRLGRFLRRLEHETFLELLSEEPGTLTRR